MLAASFLVLAAGLLFTRWTGEPADRRLREALLGRARRAPLSREVESVRSLSGSQADLDSPGSLALKTALAAVLERWLPGLP